MTRDLVKRLERLEQVALRPEGAAIEVNLGDLGRVRLPPRAHREFIAKVSAVLAEIESWARELPGLESGDRRSIMIGGAQQDPAGDDDGGMDRLN